MKLSAVKFARYLLTVSLTLNIFSQTTLGAIFTQNHRSTTETTFVDPRSALDRNKTPALNAIGIIDVSGQSNVVSKKPSPELLKAFRPGLQVGRGSGFLINACLVVTNHHVAFIARDTDQITDIKIQFTIPTIKTTYEGIIIDSGNYKSNFDAKEDWAIIKLEKSVANMKDPKDIRHKWKIKPNFSDDIKIARRNKNVQVASYYIDVPSSAIGAELLGQKCSIYAKIFEENLRNYSVGPGSWAHDCASIPGASGSPVFFETSNKELHAYGLIQSVYTRESYVLKVTNDNLNFMSPFVNALSEERLQKIIQDNPCN